MLIRCYGKFWLTENVYWGERGPGNSGRMDGFIKVGKHRIDVDVWDQIGIYALHKNFRTVYIGKSVNQTIGQRIKQHLYDRTYGRWDTFSWFGSKIVKKDGTLRSPGTRAISQNMIINTLESLAIMLTDPPLNRREESIPNALYVEQYVEESPSNLELLNQLLEKVNSIEETLESWSE